MQALNAIICGISLSSFALGILNFVDLRKLEKRMDERDAKLEVLFKAFDEYIKIKERIDK